MNTEKDLLFLKETVDAARKSLSGLISQIRPILGTAEEELRNLYGVTSKIEELLAQNNPLQTRLENLDLDVRPFNLLKEAEINTVGDLLDKTEDEILAIKGMGVTSFTGIKKIADEWREKMKNIKPAEDILPFVFETGVNPAEVL